jgi:hypothetical protein
MTRGCNSSVVSCSYRSDRIENTIRLLLFYGHYLAAAVVNSHYLATGLHATICWEEQGAVISRSKLCFYRVFVDFLARHSGS